MRQLVLAAPALLLSHATAVANPEVSNVSTSQVLGTHQIRVTYDLANPGNGPCAVKLQASNDAGETYWDLPASATAGNSGTLGTGVSPGNGHVIMVDASEANELPCDLSFTFSRSIRFRIIASDDPGGLPSLDLISVEGGTLAMSVGTLTVGPFQLAKHEVNWGEWSNARSEALSRGYDIQSAGAGCADDHPVHSVNWYDVVKWCNLKSEIDGLEPVYTVDSEVYRSGQSVPTQNLSADGYRLPSEAEWEFAARGGNQSNGYVYSGSNTLDAVGWYRDNSSGSACALADGRGTWPVGQKAPNELGFHDMSGNVIEWCWDQYGTFQNRRLRGGGWYSWDLFCAVADRTFDGLDRAFDDYGLRVARSLPADTRTPLGFTEIAGGSFTMGSPDGTGGTAAELGRYSNEEQHTVALASFFMKRTEVTKEEWDVVASWASANGYDLAPGSGSGTGTRHPVTDVTWHECLKWCNAFTEYETLVNGKSLDPCYYTNDAKTLVYRSGITDVTNSQVNWDANGYRLPTEAEWEYACRAGTTTAFYTGPITSLTSDPNMNSAGWYSPNSGSSVHPVADPSKAGNDLGLRDMHGNVWEWCWDWYGASYYASSPTTDPHGPASGSLRVERGGSWNNEASICRSALRARNNPGNSGSDVGFRPVSLSPAR